MKASNKNLFCFQKAVSFFLISLFILSIVSSCKSVEGPATNTLPDLFAYAKRLYEYGAYSDANLELQKLTYTSRATEYEDDVQFYLGLSYYQNRQFLLSSDAYQTLLRNVPGSPYGKQAFFGIASCYYSLSPTYALDQEYTRRAISQYQAFLETYPPPDSAKIAEEIDNLKTLLVATDDSTRKTRYNDLISRLQAQYGQLDTLRLAEERIQICRAKLARKTLETAKQYVNLRAFRSATLYFDEVMTSFSDSELYEEALLGKIDMLRIRKRWQDAMAEIEKYEDRFPAKKNVVESVKRTVESELSGTQSALQY
ncbi:MAG: outer membrane protein assembly factor BamD [Chloroherpetonaceae bacterium]|nr:outer membrane protein assembly factor BamD [Chloroherpetonaceae bacterium]